MRLMRLNRLALFLAVLAISFAPVASALACGACVDECCPLAKLEHARIVVQAGSLVAILPAPDSVGTESPHVMQQYFVSAYDPFVEPIAAPLRI